ncbi:class I adenylate-forming enzyme family protein [Aeromicrobium sp. UC242_57]|uniref:class I adenylate-forming enzyme family protein n=1 Tax=Aeromicrobium sp. UC242_57 TaxID=3374624 RepID=UPI0037BA1F11
MNVLSVIERVARRRGTHLALRSEDVLLTYEELLDRASRIGAYLVREGLKPGERVAVFLHNQPEYLPMVLGIWKAGGVFVPLNALFAPSAIRHAVEDSETRWVLTRPDAVGTVREALEGLEVAARIISTGPADGAVVTFDDVIATDPLPTTVPRKDHDNAVLMYTSGSTGRPKGVRQTHRNTVAASEATMDVWEMTDEDHALVCTPLFHVGGLQLISLPALLAGATVTLMKWSVDEYLRLAVSLEPTVLAIVPAMMIDIVNTHETGRHLDSVRVCAVGGSALPAARLEAFTRATGVVPVNIYGQTEQAGLAICEPLHEARREGTLGRPLSSIVEHRIVALGSNNPSDVAVEGELLGPWRRRHTGLLAAP